MKLRAFAFGVIYMLISHICSAQVCTSGAYGPAAFTQTFGSGSTVIGPALPASMTSSYTYSGSVAPSDGQYTIASSSAGMYGNWWTIADHTGNTGGYMLIVNTKFDPSDPSSNNIFYQETASLCPNTTYQFNVSLKNLLQTATQYKPNITITLKTVGGTLLKTYNTGDIGEDPSAAWGTPTNFLFATPSNENNVVITMENNNHGGTGNDFAMDDVIIKPCGPMMIAGFGDPTVMSPTYNNCTGNPVQDTLTAKILPAPYANPQYQWQVNSGGGWSNITGATSTAPYYFPQPAAVGTYQYRLASADGSNINTSSCLIYSNVITLTVTQSPTATASTASTTVCEGSSITLNGGGGTSYTWKNPAGTIFSTSQNPVINNITPSQAGKYTVTATLNGCTSQASVTIIVQPKITATTGPNVTICEGSSTQLTASGGVSYSWSPTTGLSNPNIANPVASPTDTTKYTVTATNNSCTSTASVTVNVIKKPVISAGGDKTVLLGKSVKLTGTAKGQGSLTYNWTPATGLDDPHSLTPSATPTATTTYTLSVTSSCTTVTDTSRVTVFITVQPPNVFSPNGDTVNDKWEIPGLVTYPGCVVSVYTRNGQMVFTSIGYGKQWDGTYNGKQVPDGTYYYTIDLKNGDPMMSGYVMVVR